MGGKYIIGVDSGTQSSKVVIFDLRGNIVCESKVKVAPINTTGRGVAEHPDDDLWETISTAGRQAIARFPGRMDDIVGVGLCTIRCCRALLQDDGKLASPVISWMDVRLASPYEADDDNVRYVTTSSGYITHRLTGERRDTAANYEGEWPLNKDTWNWSEDIDIISKYNIPRGMLFDLDVPGTILGTVTRQASIQTGFPAGIPVVATANDKAVEALGAGLLPGRTALISLGTYIGAMVYGDKNLGDGRNFFTNLASIPHQYLYESGGIRRGMWTVSWFQQLLGEDVVRQARDACVSPEEFLNSEAMEVPVGSDGLMTVLDWLAPPDRPFKKGIMIGFDGRHTRSHIYRSILEAIALTMKNYVDGMSGELGIELDDIIVSGGGSNSDLFMQIFADVFGVPASRTVINGSASLGAAMCVAVALGYCENFAAAIDRMVQKRDRFDPIEKHTELYNRLNDEVYKHIPGSIDKILKKSYKIFQ